jgi:hypothetical protein
VVESLVRNRLKGHRRGGPIDRRRGYELRELREVARAGHLPVGAVAREHQRSWIVGRFPASAASGRPAPGPHVLDGHSGARGSSTRHADPGEITSVLSKARDAGRNGRKRSHRERAKGSHRPRCRSRRPHAGEDDERRRARDDGPHRRLTPSHSPPRMAAQPRLLHRPDHGEHILYNGSVLTSADPEIDLGAHRVRIIRLRSGPSRATARSRRPHLRSARSPHPARRPPPPRHRH